MSTFRRLLDDLKAHDAGAGADEANGASSRPGNVEDAPLELREAVVDPNDHAPAGGKKRHSDPRAEGPFVVGRRQGVLVEDLAARGALAVVARPVPGGDAFHEDRKSVV